jgi:hypothetical protein
MVLKLFFRFECFFTSQTLIQPVIPVKVLSIIEEISTKIIKVEMKAYLTRATVLCPVRAHIFQLPRQYF